jgi:hypothetical protein
MREAEVVDGDGLEDAVLDAAVAAVAGGIQDWDSVPGQALAAGQQGGLVGLDREQVVGLFTGDQELGRVRMGVEGVGGDHRPGQVEPVQQRLERGDLLGGATNLALGQHRAAGVVHTGQQVHPAAVGACPAGAAQRLAVDRHRPLPWPLPPVGASAVAAVMALAAGQGVGVQPGQGAADGGPGRDGEAAGGVMAGAEGDPDWLGRISGPFGDRGDRPGAGQHRGGGQGQDGD